MSVEGTRPEPVRHPVTNRKIADWKLEIVKPIVVLGDSNLGNLPEIRDGEIQVDIFPGASFNHVRGVLEKLSPKPEIKTVVLALGLNNGALTQTVSTSWKQFQQLYKTCGRIFPRADIFFPQGRYPGSLDMSTQERLDDLEEKIYTELKPMELTGCHAPVEMEVGNPACWSADYADHLLTSWVEEIWEGPRDY